MLASQQLERLGHEDVHLGSSIEEQRISACGAVIGVTVVQSCLGCVPRRVLRQTTAHRGQHGTRDDPADLRGRPFALLRNGDPARRREAWLTVLEIVRETLERDLGLVGQDEPRELHREASGHGPRFAVSHRASREDHPALGDVRPGESSYRRPRSHRSAVEVDIQTGPDTRPGLDSVPGGRLDAGGVRFRTEPLPKCERRVLLCPRRRCRGASTLADSILRYTVPDLSAPIRQGWRKRRSFL